MDEDKEKRKHLVVKSVKDEGVRIMMKILKRQKIKIKL